MNALIPLAGMGVGALATVFGVVLESIRRRGSKDSQRAVATKSPSQVLITVSGEQTPEQQPRASHSEVVIYTTSGKAEHYALAESPSSVSMRVEEAAQRALHVGEPTRVETAEAPRIALAD